jgi:Bacterial alpha-L-rhamnosidase C-terminal domain/Bacterial alpha-L-rhamnosidase 6 hairpin glycosidase domain
VTAFNDLYYVSLRDVAYIEAHLGNTAKAEAYGETADHVRDAINANLLNPATGTYYLSASDHTTFAQDANALSVLFGVAPASKVPGILSALRTLWGQHGSEPFSGTTYSNLISPYITAYEVEADYLAGDTADAERLMHLTWDQMIDTDNPFFTGTMWENIGPDGTATESRTSLAHGWASGPTPIMTSYVLGVQPVNPGYQAFTVAPHPGSLRWAEGAVPTPYGRIFVRWAKTGRRISVTVEVPAGTTALVTLPDGFRATVGGGAHGAERTFVR